MVLKGPFLFGKNFHVSPTENSFFRASGYHRCIPESKTLCALCALRGDLSAAQFFPEAEAGAVGEIAAGHAPLPCRLHFQNLENRPLPA